MCLPTGTTPLPVYAQMTDGFADATVFLLDEYVGLPEGHPGRCAQVLREALLDHIDLPDGAFYVPDVDAGDLDRAARHFDAPIAENSLDLAVLGLGANGHVGMNEPGSPADAPTRVVTLTAAPRTAARRYGIDDPPRRGLTIGMQRLLEAREVWLLVAGARKRGILQRALHGPVTTDVPASLLRRHPRLTVWAADDALD